MRVEHRGAEAKTNPQFGDAGADGSGRRSGDLSTGRYVCKRRSRARDRASELEKVQEGSHRARRFPRQVLERDFENAFMELYCLRPSKLTDATL